MNILYISSPVKTLILTLMAIVVVLVWLFYRWTRKSK